MNLHKILTITATFYAVERNREESLHSVAGKLSAYALRLCGYRECLPVHGKLIGEASAARDGAPAEGLVVVVLRHMTVDVDPAQQGKDQREGG